MRITKIEKLSLAAFPTALAPFPPAHEPAPGGADDLDLGELRVAAAPARHVSPGLLRARLKDVVGTRAARLGTLHELTKLAPVAISAEALGYSPATIERHAIDSATAYASYIAAVRDDAGPR